MNRQQAWDFGNDCRVNGANNKNCHISIFSEPQFTRAWELGKAGIAWGTSRTLNMKSECNHNQIRRVDPYNLQCLDCNLSWKREKYETLFNSLVIQNEQRVKKR